jgi:anti-sigma factor RsiW
MKCNEVAKHLDDFVLEELDQKTEIQVNEHCAQCDACKKALKKHYTVADLLKGSERFEPPAHLYGRVKSNVFVPKREKRVMWGIPRSFVFAVTAFFLGVVVMRAVDVYLMSVRSEVKTEIRTEPLRQEQHSDTVKFHTVPAENLARI